MDKKGKSKTEDQMEEQIDEAQSSVSSTPSDTQALEQELEELKSQFENMNNQLKRAVADYHNLEKRVADGRSELITWATGDLIKKIIPVLDNFQRATTGVSEEEQKSGWYKGVEMALKQLKDVLKSEGLEEIAADGQFDPTLHEAIDTRVGDEGKIIEVVGKGYALNGKTIRPVQVIVGRKES